MDGIWVKQANIYISQRLYDGHDQRKIEMKKKKERARG